MRSTPATLRPASGCATGGCSPASRSTTSPGADAVDFVDAIGTELADLAGAALDAAIMAARGLIGRADGAPASHGTFPAAEVAATRLAIIGMGKAGARELNYVSDVDVIFVAESDDEAVVSTPRALDIATRLAMTAMRLISEAGIEPPLWEVDPNLRPEGKYGALVRTLESHLQYYDRWAKSWEFQALLKARPLAGDRRTRRALRGRRGAQGLVEFEPRGLRRVRAAHA